MSSNRFKMLRERLGLSQVELGDKIGVTQQSVYAWERGDAMPRLQTAIALSELYHVSIDYILGRSDNPDNSTQSVTDTDDELRSKVIDQISGLSDPALGRVLDFLDGLSAGISIGSDITDDHKLDP